MSKATLGLIAAAGAATGAAATALFYNSRGQSAPAASPAVTSAVAAGAAAGVAAAATVAANNRTAPAPAPQQRRNDVPTNPAGFFQYGGFSMVPYGWLRREDPEVARLWIMEYRWEVWNGYGIWDIDYG
jgi:hypothetical protein